MWQSLWVSVPIVDVLHFFRTLICYIVSEYVVLCFIYWYNVRSKVDVGPPQLQIVILSLVKLYCTEQHDMPYVMDCSVRCIEKASWRIKDQLDVTCYFISLLMYSTCFGHEHIHHQELATMLLNCHSGRLVLGSLCVGDLVRMGLNSVRVAGWSSAPTHNEPRTKRPMR